MEILIFVVQAMAVKVVHRLPVELCRDVRAVPVLRAAMGLEVATLPVLQARAAAVVVGMVVVPVQMVPVVVADRRTPIHYTLQELHIREDTIVRAAQAVQVVMARLLLL
jgi:hypothetical protein